MLSFLKERRRKQVKARPFSNEWRQQIKKNVAFFERLSADDQAELLGHTQVLISEKGFEGCAGQEITDEIRVTIAAQASLLLLHRKTDYFPRLMTILVYPSVYSVQEQRLITAEIWEEGKSFRAGETERRMGSMVLAWDAVKSGAADPSDGTNVVLHEFAHQLDYENLAADGTPALASRKQQMAWQQVMHTEFASLRAAEQTGIPTLLDTYGATNAAEFFAVSVEAFFERPLMLRSQHAKLYAQFQQYFQQDPVEFSAERIRR
jgi:MtfA peptidase